MTSPRSNSPVLLETKDLAKHFGGVKAIDGVSLEVYEGEILSIIGPNGAGKTTFFNVVSGLMEPTRGSAIIQTSENGKLELTGRSMNEIARRGLVRTFQNVRPFSELTVLENILAGIGNRHYRSMRLFERFSSGKAIEEAEDLLEQFGLSSYKNSKGDELPLALIRRLEVARALSLEPQLLLLDEPAAGLNEEESQEFMNLLRELVEDGYTIVLVSHSMDLVMNVSDRIYVFDQGKIIAEGNAEEIQTDERVVEAYFGEGQLDA